MSKNFKNNRSEALKFLLTSEEKSLVKSYLENYNDKHPKNRVNMSEFLRNILFKSLLNMQNSAWDNLENNLNNNKQKNDKNIVGGNERFEKLLNRNLLLLYKMMERTLGKEETEKILEDVKKEEER
jgi:hypothetical protein